MANVRWLNGCSEADARDALLRCCGSRRWVQGMLARRPFADDAALAKAAAAVWAEMEHDDILEAFSHHPRIGADLAALRQKFAMTSGWASAEQAGVGGASEQTLRALQAGNLAYEARFGYIFIVCATGKSAEQMLALLTERLENSPEHEIEVAAAEQAAITQLRLAKLEDLA